MRPPDERAGPRIPALHQPALVLAHGLALEADARALLAGTGLSQPELDSPHTELDAVQLLRLLHNLARAVDERDTAFTLGARLLPGHYGAASHALLQAGSLREALALLVRFQGRLSPLLAPHLVVDGGLAVLHWTPTCALGAQRPFVVDMAISSVAAMTQWLAGRSLPWTFCLNRTAPREREHHEAHLGTALRFDCQIDALLIDDTWLDRPWPRHTVARPAAANTAQAALCRAAEQESPPPALLPALYALLHEQVRMPPTLEACARHFGTSPATFKRRLAALGTHYQAELDQVRCHVALQLFRCRGLDNEGVAAYLGFHDATNFRRSFKRWTGLAPGLLRDSLDALGTVA